MSASTPSDVTPLEREYLARLHAEWMQAAEQEQVAQRAFARALGLLSRRLGLRGELFYDCERGTFTSPPGSPTPSSPE